ncbi:MAG: DUF2293 domain-containing protein [Lentisphaeria bacterium]|nr:DUF2293 domain-containing protein [Lentisphaeria bacterium]NQZ67282.1 DUF2293 domain-containing protein [Lentisphaeria bacterium]
MQWIERRHFYNWKDGLHQTLDENFNFSDKKQVEALAIFEKQMEGHKSIDIPWHEHSLLRGECLLRVSAHDSREALYQRYYFANDLTDRKRKSIEKKLTAEPSPRIFLKVGKDTECEMCETPIFKGDFFYLDIQKPYCMKCLNLNHLSFLPSGDATLSRRAREFSESFAEVVEWSRRGRYERRGILVDEAAIEKAEASNLQDAEKRKVGREKGKQRQIKIDVKHTEEFQKTILDIFPSCPRNEVASIAFHATVRSSGRVGRTAAAKKLDNKMIRLAVIAYIRHKHTDYDELLSHGFSKDIARKKIQGAVQEKLKSWEMTLDGYNSLA